MRTTIHPSIGKVNVLHFCKLWTRLSTMKRKPKQPEDGIVSARLPIDILEALKRTAESETRTVGNMVRVLIAEGLASREKQQAEKE